MSLQIHAWTSQFGTTDVKTGDYSPKNILNWNGWTTRAINNKISGENAWKNFLQNRSQWKNAMTWIFNAACTCKTCRVSRSHSLIDRLADSRWRCVWQTCTECKAPPSPFHRLHAVYSKIKKCSKARSEFSPSIHEHFIIPQNNVIMIPNALQDHSETIGEST